MNSFNWYIPTFHGDIKLEKKDAETTLLRAYELTPIETQAMRLLRDKALSAGKPWAEEKDFGEIGGGAYRSKDGVEIVLRAPIQKVQAILAKQLKPGRQLIDAYLFSDGTMEEIRRAPTKTDDEDGDPLPPLAKEKKEPKAAATVAAPSIGCPTPDFPESEVRATRVLEVFLKPGQLRDYRATGVFTATGIDTGHQYAVTHRGRRENMRNVSFRSLYDMTEDRPLCVHDWSVPPPEEMLALLLCLSLPGKEHHIRHLPEVFLA